MKFLPQLVALLIILVFVIIVLLMIRMGRIKTAEKTHQTSNLGFAPLSDLPPQLASRVDDLYKRKDQQAVYIDQIFQRRELDREYFIFDVSDSHDDDNEMGTEVFGLISPEFDLPRFSLTTLPGFNSDSLLGGLMKALLDKVLQLTERYQGMTRIDLSDKPDFGDQVVVFGSDETAVRELLRGIYFSSLSSSNSPLHIAGQGDFLTVDFSLPSSSGSAEGDLISQYQQFEQIARQFQK